MTRDLAALARTLEALRALHACPLCHGSGEVRDDDGDKLSCSSCDGSGIAAPRVEDDVAALVAELRALTARVEAAEREASRARRTLDRLRAWRPCIACLDRAEPGCDACDGTGVAEVRHDGVIA